MDNTNSNESTEAAKEPTVTETPTLAAPAEPPRKPHKSRTILLVLAGIFLLVGLGAVAYFVFFQPKTNSANESSATKTQNEQQSESTKTQQQTITAAALIEKVRTTLNEKQAVAYPGMTLENTDYAPAYKPAGSSYAVTAPGDGHGFMVDPVPSDYNQAAVDAITATIDETLVKEGDLTAEASDWQTIYQNESLVCSVTTNSSPVTVLCADVSVYSDEITEARPFADAYAASDEGKNNTDMVFSLNRVVNKSGSYKNAQVSMSSYTSPVGGFAGLFYSTNNGASWTFWRGTQSLISCSEYETPELTQAFLGEACYDDTNNAESVVQTSE